MNTKETFRFQRHKDLRESFINIIEDIIEQAREQKDDCWIKTTRWKHTRKEITREALDNFEDEIEEKEL